MMTEWTGMAGDYPAMFGNSGLLGFLNDSQPIMKVLDRFLAGLIPIKAKATSHVVVELDGVDYVVDRAALGDLEITSRPLYVVGVTEHLGYWRDIRRVLFSDASFNVLCRVARDGIHDRWTPVKLADLFSEVAPDFVDAINAVRMPTAGATSSPPKASDSALTSALVHYEETFIPADGELMTDEAKRQLVEFNLRHGAGPADVISQRAAFDQLKELIQAITGTSIDGDTDLEARRNARQAAGLDLWSDQSFQAVAPTTTASGPTPEERMLDVEVIAIYW